VEAFARITAKGQVTVPESVRDALDIKDGDEIVFRVEGRRAVIAKTNEVLRARRHAERPRGKAKRRVGRAGAENPIVARHDS
jgi:AbrB family looped-hinge helix DNA binding protein